jgi:hypothetical protein
MTTGTASPGVAEVLRQVPAPGAVDGSRAPRAHRRRRGRALERDGCNELPSARPRSLASIALGVAREPMFLMLIGGRRDLRRAGRPSRGAGAGRVGRRRHRDHVPPGAQERARARGLRELASPRALVLRDGAWTRIAGREVVVGDVFQVREGDRVPADGELRRERGHRRRRVAADAANRCRCASARWRRRRRRRDRAATTRRPSSRARWSRAGSASRARDRDRHAHRARAHRQGAARDRARAVGIQRETRRAVLVFAAIGIALCVW